MSFSGSITIHGGSAGAVFHESGAINLPPFTSYSAFLSDQLHFTKSSYVEIDNGNFVLKSKYGNIVTTEQDTISASIGHSTVIGGSLSISFVAPTSATTKLFSTPFAETLTGGSHNPPLAALAAEFAQIESKMFAPLAHNNFFSPSHATVTAPVAEHKMGQTLELGAAQVSLVMLNNKS